MTFKVKDGISIAGTTFVDGSRNITAGNITAGTVTAALSGNATTVTNGVYTTGSYADPTWITSLAKSKVGLGNVENTALSTWAGSTNLTTLGAATATSLGVTNNLQASKAVIAQGDNATWTGKATFLDYSTANDWGRFGAYDYGTGTWKPIRTSSPTTIDSSLTVTGNLTINGTTTTINSTTVTIDDPIFTLGGDTAPTVDDNKDRGIEFRWHNGTTSKIGFFGFDDSTGYLTFIPDATNTSEVFSGTQGDIQATNFRGALVGNASTATTATNLSGGTVSATTGTFSSTLTSSFAPAAINTATPGLTNYGFIFNGSSSTDNAQGITWTWATSGAAQAGIYVQSSGNYGTKMYIATTDSFATGSRTAISIDHTGLTNFVRARPTALGNTILDAGNYNTYSPTLTGTGASGTWSISVTGNAATATTLQTARTINGVSFNGSANISITRTESKGSLSAETLRSVHDVGIYTFNTNNLSLGDSTPVGYWSTISFGNGSNGSAQIAVDWTSSGNNLWFRSLRDTVDNWWTWKRIYHDNYHPEADRWTNARTITLGGDLTGSVSINGSADVTLSAQVVDDSHNHTNYMLRSSSSQTDPNTNFNSSAYRFDPNANNPTNEHYAIITYGNQSNVTGQLATHFTSGQTFTRAYNTAWSAWRTQLDSSNYNSYSPTLTGSGASGTWSINVTGNAGTATTWQTARTITIGSTGKSVNGGGNVSWTLAEIGAQAAGSYLTGESDTLGSVTGRGFTTRASSGAFATANQGIPGLEVYGGGTTEPAYMTFHRPGLYAVRFGLDGSDLKVGGWSMGAVAYTMLHSNNYTSYSPSLTGSGASGTWTISITGNAATATTANSANSVAWTNVSGRPTTVSSFSNDSNYISGSSPALINGASQISGSNSALCVQYSGGGSQYGITLKPSADSTTVMNIMNAAGTSVGSISQTSTGITFNGAIAWTNVSGRPTAVSSFTNDSGYITSSGSISGNAATATTASSVAWTNVSGRPTAVSSFTNDSGYITSSSLSSYLPLTGGTVSGNLYLSANGQGVSASSTLRVNGDITTARGNGTSGVIYLGNSGSTYVYYDGANYYMPSGQLDVNGSRVLNAGNYTSYSPSLTGGGASGSWGISVTGSAGSVAWTNVSGRPTALSSFSNDSGYITSSSLSSYLALSGGTMTGTITSSASSLVIGTQGGVTRGYLYNDSSGFGLLSSTGNWVAQIPYGTSNLQVSGNITTAGHQVLHANNYTSYSPSLTGGGASGTWAISISGNAATVGGFTPVQQGGGTSQGTNKVYIGWHTSSDGLRLQVDSTNFNRLWPIDVSGNAATATTASSANSVAWTNVSGRPTTVSSFTNDSGYITSSGSISGNAATATTASSVAWTNVSGRPTAVSSFTNDSGYITSSGSISGNAATATTASNTNAVAGYSISWGYVAGAPYYIWGTPSGTGTTRVYSAAEVAVGSATYSTYAGSSSLWTTGGQDFYGRGKRVAVATVGNVVYNYGGDFSNAEIQSALLVSGNITAYASDRRLKTNIVPITNALERLNKLSGFTYNWNGTAKSLAKYNTEITEVGVFAQDVQQVQPEAVKAAPFDTHHETGQSISGENYLTVQYDKLVPLLIEAVKECSNYLEQQEARINQLESLVKALVTKE